MFNDNDQIRKMAVRGFVVAEFLIFFFWQSCAEIITK